MGYSASVSFNASLGPTTTRQPTLENTQLTSKTLSYISTVAAITGGAILLATLNSTSNYTISASEEFNSVVNMAAATGLAFGLIAVTYNFLYPENTKHIEYVKKTKEPNTFEKVFESTDIIEDVIATAEKVILASMVALSTFGIVMLYPTYAIGGALLGLAGFYYYQNKEAIDKTINDTLESIKIFFNSLFEEDTEIESTIPVIAKKPIYSTTVEPRSDKISRYDDTDFWVDPWGGDSELDIFPRHLPWIFETPSYEIRKEPNRGLVYDLSEDRGLSPLEPQRVSTEKTTKKEELVENKTKETSDIEQTSEKATNTTVIDTPLQTSTIDKVPVSTAIPVES